MCVKYKFQYCSCLTALFFIQKCDGSRPVCGACARSDLTDDCEYTDAEGRSRTQLLEKNIARLQSRVRELEHPEDGGSGITLHDPYAFRPPSRMDRPGSRMDRRPFQAVTGGRTVPSASGNNATHFFGLCSDAIALGSGLSSSGRYHNQTLNPDETPPATFENVETWWHLDELPLHIKQQLYVPLMIIFSFLPRC